MVNEMTICFGGKKNFRYIGVEMTDENYFFEGEKYTRRPKLNCFGLETLSDEEIADLKTAWRGAPRTLEAEIIE